MKLSRSLCKFFSFLLVCLGLQILFSCESNEPDNAISFETSAQTFPANSNSVAVTMKLERPVRENAPHTVLFTSEGVEYKKDFTIEPQPARGTIFLTIPTGEQKASFTIDKAADFAPGGNGKIFFAIDGTGEQLRKGTIPAVALNFQGTER